MTVRLLSGHVLDRLRELPDGSVHLVVTSPPYWALRAYGTPPQFWGGDPGCHHELEPLAADSTAAQLCRHCSAWQGELGHEPVPDCLAWARQEPPCALCYVYHLRVVFQEVWRVLRADGTVFLNLGDTYTGSGCGRDGRTGIGTHSRRQGFVGGTRSDPRVAARGWPAARRWFKSKNLCLLPERVALALQEDGWIVRSAIVWNKVRPMPESVRDRPTRSWEYVWMLARQERYFYDPDGLRQPPPSSMKIPPESWANLRNCWSIPTEPHSEPHYAAFPEELPRRAILLGTSERGCCPACGAPWRRVVERQMARKKLSPRALSAMREGQRLVLSGRQIAPHRRVTLGWEPTCRHRDQQPVPCLVLDPFAGIGTTLRVAQCLGRDAIGIELNDHYAALAQQRLLGEQPLLGWEGAA
jgi:DNA modification methylase